jgi:hypothetical protein
MVHTATKRHTIPVNLAIQKQRRIVALQIVILHLFVSATLDITAMERTRMAVIHVHLENTKTNQDNPIVNPV